MIFYCIFFEFLVNYLNNISVYLLLQPRTFVYKRRHKKRKCLSFSNNANNLNYGSAGLLLLKPIHLTANQLFRFKLFLKRASKKADSTKRFVWFHAFPHLPLTRKPNGIRMGKGKGKLECWFTNVTGGSVLMEFRNLRKGRAAFFMKQITNKIGAPTKFLYVNNLYLNFPLAISKKIAFTTFW